MKRLDRICRSEGDDSVSGINVCSVCGNVWSSRCGGSSPKTCPSCRSALWNRSGVRKANCFRCGHIWITSGSRPLRCPSCRSRLWYRKELTITCLKCGKVWTDPVHKGCGVTCPSCGLLSRKEYSVSAKHPDDSGSGGAEGILTECIIAEMQSMEGTISRTLYLRNKGLTPLQADIIVRFCRGESVPEISSRMLLPVAETMRIVLPYIELCDSGGMEKRK